MQTNLLIIVSLLSLSPIIAQATLIDRGGGLLYDNVLNITWLQDANYAKTSGFAGASADGIMNWQTAQTWVDNLVYHDSVRNVDYSDWRLPTVNPVIGSSFNYDTSYNGSTDVGFNITSQNSELSYMYYVNLGLKGYYSPTGNYQADWGIFGNGTYGGQNNLGVIVNLQANAYWSNESPLSPVVAWYFGSSGYQDTSLKDGGKYAWAVREGDVAAVPEPATILLFGTGILILLNKTRRLIA